MEKKEKKTYRTPELVKFGTVEKLTGSPVPSF
jgi:hypothetical protein